MKKLWCASIGLSLLAVTLPLLAQAPDLSHIYAEVPNKIADVPLDPNNPSGILPAQFKAAYGFNRIPNRGQGQTIALIDAYDNPNLESDLAFYANYFHLAPCNFQKVIVGSPTGDFNWGLEEALDVEQACALAPQANIILVEANSNSFNDLFAAIAVASTPPYNATVVSMSWRTDEFFGETQSDSTFCNIVNGNEQAVTFVAASGDTGHGASYPAVSPCVVAAGGTTLALSTPLPPPNPLQLNYGMETAWNGSGGGLSRWESQPSWQNLACATWSNSMRCNPDIASDSNPGTGVPVYDTYGFPGWLQDGGTSLATPDWAAFFALVNAGRTAAGGTTLSQALQDLYSVYYSNNYSSDFHDITTGTNGSCGSQCTAGTGYDLVTGIGTYQANNLYPALVAAPN